MVKQTFDAFWTDLAAVRVNNAPVPYWYCGCGEEQAELYRLGGLAEGPIAELGTYTGVGAALLAGGGDQTVYTIDPSLPGWDRGNNITLTDHHGRCQTERSIETAQALWQALDLTDRINWVEASCYDEEALSAAPDALGLLFVDAEHQVPHLTKQLALWAPRVAPGGYLVLHDWGLPGDERQVGTWDVAGVAGKWVAEHGGADEWRGPVVVSTVAWYRRKPLAEEVVEE